jgi:hypothetical protein
MDHSETLAILGTSHRTKTNKTKNIMQKNNKNVNNTDPTMV